MAKRFTDSNKWQDEWFYELRPEFKMLWFFLCDHCDAAGVWKVSRRFAENTIGMAITWDRAIQEMDGRIIELAGGQRWFLVKYIPFQYHGGLIAANSVHKSVLAMLRAHGIDPSPFLKIPESGVSQARVTQDSPTQAQAQVMNSSSEGSAEGETTGAKQRKAIKEQCAHLVICQNAKAVSEWIDGLRDHAHCTSLEEGLSCMEWAVSRARADGKEVSYLRNCINYVMQWPNSKPAEWRKKRPA